MFGGFNPNMRGGRFDNSARFGPRGDRGTPRWQNRDRNGYGRGGGPGPNRFNHPGNNRSEGGDNRHDNSRNDNSSRGGPSNRSESRENKTDAPKTTPSNATSTGPTTKPEETPAPIASGESVTPKSSTASSRTEGPSSSPAPRGGAPGSAKKEAPSPRKPVENSSKSSTDTSNVKRDLNSDRKPHSLEDSNRSGSDKQKDRKDERRRTDGDKNRDEHNDLAPLKVLKKFTGRCRLFVGNLTSDTTEEEFVKLFEKYGETNEPFLNAARGFGFIRMETRHKAEDARAALDGKFWKGRNLRVRFAAHGASLRVKYLSQHVSNEMLEEAFSQFGEVERAIIVVDDRGRPSGEGIVDFARKGGALSALNRINEGVFLMTTSLRPIMVEPLEDKDEQDGLPEIFFQQTAELIKEREQPPRFAQPSSVEYEYGQKWKNLYQMYKEREELLKRNFEEEAMKLDQDQETAKLEQHAAMLRQDLLRRQEELRRLEEQTQMELQRRLELRRMDDDRRRKELEMIESRRRQTDIQQLIQHSQQQTAPQQQGPPQMSQALGPPPSRQQEWPPQQQLRGEGRGIAAPPPVPPALAMLERARAQGLNLLQGGPGGPPGAMSQGMPIPNLAGPPNPGLRPVRFDQPGPGGMGINGGPVGPGPAGGMMREIGAKSGPQGGPGPHDEYFDPKRPRRY